LVQLEALGDPVARRRLADKPRSDIGEKRAPKFRDPQNGATWSGHGREPGWLKGKNRQDFAVKE
jgi:DNA-binding protein H-NS